MKVDTVDDVRRNTVFTVASMMKGAGVLRPECSALLVGRTASNTDSDTSWAQGAGKLFTSTPGLYTEVTGAHEGGAKAAIARNELRVLLGNNFSREFVGTSSSGFPYA